MQAQLESLADVRNDVNIRKIELPRGSSAVGNQYKIRSVPHLVLYRGTDEVASGTRSVSAKLTAL